MSSEPSLAPPPGLDVVAPPSPLAEFWSRFSQNKGALGGLVVIVLLALAAISADLIAPFDPTIQDRDALLTPPFWQEGGTLTYFLGTDDLGRDMASRLIHGARVSMSIGLMVVSISLCCGVALGLVAGYFGGALETVIMRVMDVIMAVPALLMAIAIVAVLGPGLVNAMIAVSVVVLPQYVRLTRASVLTERPKPYVVASAVAGAGTWRQMVVNILPNCAAPLIVQATLGFSTAILDTAALGFLGLGAQPPTAEWGTLLADSRQYMTRAWWVVTFPGLAILITVLAFNLMGDGLRDALDPKLKR